MAGVHNKTLREVMKILSMMVEMLVLVLMVVVDDSSTFEEKYNDDDVLVLENHRLSLHKNMDSICDLDCGRHQ